MTGTGFEFNILSYVLFSKLTQFLQYYKLLQYYRCYIMYFIDINICFVTVLFPPNGVNMVHIPTVAHSWVYTYSNVNHVSCTAA